jgi:hypothetical protein
VLQQLPLSPFLMKQQRYSGSAANNRTNKLGYDLLQDKKIKVYKL